VERKTLTPPFDGNQLIVHFQSFLEFLSIKEPSVELSAADDLSCVIRTLDPANVFFLVAIRLSSDLHNSQNRIVSRIFSLQNFHFLKKN
jgi:hypothetical protein